MKENQELVRILGLVATVGIVIIAAIAGIIGLIDLINQQPGVDEVSGEEISEDKTGGDFSPDITYIGVNKAQKEGFSVDSYGKLIDTLTLYLQITKPNTERVSLVKDSLAKTGDIYNFDISITDGSKYHIRAVDLKQGKVQFVISDDKGELYSYDNTKIVEPKNNKESLASKLLPHYGTLEDGHEYSFRYDAINGKYYVDISSCGDTVIQERAKTAVNQWLDSMHYDPSQFELTIQDYCNEGL